MMYPALTITKAQEFMLAKQKSGETSSLDQDAYVDIRGVGKDIADILDSLKEEIDNLIVAKSEFNKDIDKELRPLVHQYLNGLDEEILADRDFWRYLSTIKFHNLVLLRHPKTNKSSNEEISDDLANSKFDGNWNNYGALRTDVKESLIYRLYLAANLSYDAGNKKDPYHLARIHDVDLWQSHIVRVMSGDNSKYVKALVIWFKNRDSWYKDNKRASEIEKLFGNYGNNPRTRHLRDLVKRVRRLRSNIVHEFLSDAEINELVNVEAQISIENIKYWGRANESASKKISKKIAPKKKAKKR